MSQVMKLRPIHVLAVLALAVILVLLWPAKRSEGLTASVEATIKFSSVPSTGSVPPAGMFRILASDADLNKIKDTFRTGTFTWGARQFAATVVDGQISSGGMRVMLTQSKTKQGDETWEPVPQGAESRLQDATMFFTPQKLVLVSVSDAAVAAFKIQVGKYPANMNVAAGEFRMMGSSDDLNAIIKSFPNGFSWQSGGRSYRATIKEKDGIVLEDGKFSVGINLKMLFGGVFVNVDKNLQNITDTTIFKTLTQVTLSALAAAPTAPTAPAAAPSAFKPTAADGYYQVQFQNPTSMRTTLEWEALRGYVEKNPEAQFFKSKDPVTRYKFIFNKASGKYVQNSSIQSISILKNGTRVDNLSTDMGIADKDVIVSFRPALTAAPSAFKPAAAPSAFKPAAAPAPALVTQACFDWEYYLANSPDLTSTPALREQYSSNGGEYAYRHYANGVFSGFGNRRWRDKCTGQTWQGTTPAPYSPTTAPKAAPAPFSAPKAAPAPADGYYQVQFHSAKDMLKTLEWEALRAYVRANPNAQFFMKGYPNEKFHFVFKSENSKIQGVDIHKIKDGKSTTVVITLRDMGVNSEKENLKADTVSFRVADSFSPSTPYDPYKPAAAPAPYSAPKAAPVPYKPSAAPAPADGYYDVQFHSAKNMLMKLDFVALRAFVETNPTAQFFMKGNPSTKWHFEFRKTASGYVQNGTIQSVTIYKNGQEVGTTLNDMSTRSVTESDRKDGVPDTVSFRVADFSWPSTAPPSGQPSVFKPVPFSAPKPAIVPFSAPKPAPVPFSAPPTGPVTIAQMNLHFRDTEAIIKDDSYETLLKKFGIENWIEFSYDKKQFRLKFQQGREGTERARFVELKIMANGSWVDAKPEHIPGERIAATNITGKSSYQIDSNEFKPENVTITDKNDNVVYDTSTARKLKLNTVCQKRAP